jgi:hypothetical protein
MPDGREDIAHEEIDLEDESDRRSAVSKEDRMTNINDPYRPEGASDQERSDEAIYRDVAAETGVAPDDSDLDAEAGVLPGDSDRAVAVAGESDGSETDSASKAAAASAQKVADEAKQRAGDVASTAKDKAADVAGTAKSQTRRLLSQAQEELRGQARQQQQRAASGLSATAEQLRSMADGANSDGTASSLVREAGDRADRLGQWLAAREPGDVLDEVRAFARRRPGVFIAAAGLAGVLAGRLARSLKDSDE